MFLVEHDNSVRFLTYHSKITFSTKVFGSISKNSDVPKSPQHIHRYFLIKNSYNY